MNKTERLILRALSLILAHQNLSLKEAEIIFEINDVLNPKQSPLPYVDSLKDTPKKNKKERFAE